MSRTTLIIDDDLLAEAKKISGQRTTRGVVDEALRQLVRRQRLKEFAALKGSGIVDLSDEELEDMRRDE